LERQRLEREGKRTTNLSNKRGRSNFVWFTYHYGEQATWPNPQTLRPGSEENPGEERRNGEVALWGGNMREGSRDVGLGRAAGQRRRKKGTKR